MGKKHKKHKRDYEGLSNGGGPHGLADALLSPSWSDVDINFGCGRRASPHTNVMFIVHHFRVGFVNKSKLWAFCKRSRIAVGAGGEMSTVHEILSVTGEDSLVTRNTHAPFLCVVVVRHVTSLCPRRSSFRVRSWRAVIGFACPSRRHVNGAAWDFQLSCPYV